MLEQGPIIKKILPNIIKLKLPIPRAIQNAPVLQTGLGFYMEAYVDLATCRGGMGDGPIPWTAGMQYARWLKLNRAQTEDFWYVISKVDEFYLSWSKNKNQETTVGRGKSKGFSASHQKGG
jgi:hypothetical protein